MVGSRFSERKREACPIKKKGFLKALPLLLCLALLAVFLLKDGEISAEAILNYAPRNLWLAAGFFILLYAGKSMVIVFPLLVLQLAVGILFSPGVAVAVNFLGVGVSYCIPYWMGRGSREETVGRLAKKYPKVAEIIAAQQKGDFFISFLLRTIVGLPGDVVSMYLGASGIPFAPYLCGSLLGVLPSVLMTTLMGVSIKQPSSPRFLLSVAGNVLLPVLSLGGYWLYRKRRIQKEEDGNNE